jgi:hypothetical protein
MRLPEIATDQPKLSSTAGLVGSSFWRCVNVPPLRVKT